MAYIANTAFEVTVSNSKRNDTQNITGKFGSFSGTTFTPEVCSAGFICTKYARLPLEGYENTYTLGSSGYAAGAALKNQNSWYMVAAASGTVTGTPDDHTGLYFCNNYDVNKAATSDGMTINVAGKTLGLSLQADERGDFTEAIVGEQYSVSKGNFSTLPTTSLLYCVVTDGLLVAQAAAPTDGSVYFVFDGVDKRFVEGGYDGGAKYTLECKRSKASA